MHEVGIAKAVLYAVRAEMMRRPGTIAHRVGVRIGELSAVDPEALRFCFEALVGQTELETLRLEIEACPRRHRCPDCHAEFVVHNYEVRCPKCGQARTECISGAELELAYLEVDENGTCAADGKSPE